METGLSGFKNINPDTMTNTGTQNLAKQSKTFATIQPVSPNCPLLFRVTATWSIIMQKTENTLSASM